MKERPILFNGAMVRAVLDGTKTQTRRVIKNQPFDVMLVPSGNHLFDYRRDLNDYSRVVEMKTAVTLSPYGQPGDRLWVREAWKAHTTFDHLPPRDIPQTHVWYLADSGYKAKSRTRASMHMPRWASRITLEITGMRVERLQEISEADALAEGIPSIDTPGAWTPPIPENPNLSAIYRGAFCKLWESINGPESWDANPWLWVVEFKPLEQGQ